MINLNGKKFRMIENVRDGEVSSETIFNYHQNDKIVWAEYAGGIIRKGHLLGMWKGGKLYFSYHHINQSGDIKSGKCTSTPVWNKEVLKMYESWEWHHSGTKGNSIIQEVIS